MVFAVLQWRVIRQQAKLAEGSLRLQEAGFQQWVRIENWGVSFDNKAKEISIHFAVMNPTDRPLRFDIVLPKINGVEARHLTEGKATYLVPGSPFPMTLPFDEGQLPALESRRMSLEVEIAIFFTDAGQRQWRQTFTGQLTYNGFIPLTEFREYRTTLDYSGLDRKQYERKQRRHI